MIKDEDEIELLARACAITGQAFAEVLGQIVPGRTERDFAVLLERAMIDLGAEGLAFDTIVASGPEWRDPAPFAGRPGLRAGRPDHDRLRCPVRRLPRGHDQNGGARASPPPGSGRFTTW